MRLLVSLATFALFAVPASVSPRADDVELVVSAPRQHMLNPVMAARGFGKTVRFGARLSGDPEDNEEYYCLDEIWDWGDGTESVSEPDCDPYEAGVELQRDFSDTHTFGQGRWVVVFALMHLDEVVIKGTTEILVH